MTTPLVNFKENMGRKNMLRKTKRGMHRMMHSSLESLVYNGDEHSVSTPFVRMT